MTSTFEKLKEDFILGCIARIEDLARERSVVDRETSAWRGTEFEKQRVTRLIRIDAEIGQLERVINELSQ